MSELYEITEEMVQIGKTLKEFDHASEPVKIVCLESYFNNYFTKGMVYELDGDTVIDDEEDSWVSGSYECIGGSPTESSRLFALKSDIDAIIAKNNNALKAVTSLRNVKIDLRKPDGSVDEELSAAFQEAVFESGGAWEGSLRCIIQSHAIYLYVDGDGYLTWSSGEDFFSNHKYKQITFTYKRTIEWKATEVVDEKACKRAEVQKVVDTLQGQLDNLQEQLRVAQKELAKG